MYQKLFSCPTPNFHFHSILFMFGGINLNLPGPLPKMRHWNVNTRLRKGTYVHETNEARHLLSSLFAAPFDDSTVLLYTLWGVSA